MTEKYASHLTSLIVYVKTVLTEWMYFFTCNLCKFRPKYFFVCTCKNRRSEHHNININSLISAHDQYGFHIPCAKWMHLNMECLNLLYRSLAIVLVFFWTDRLSHTCIWLETETVT